MRRLYRASRRAADAAYERCELCGAPIAAEHAHLWEARVRAVRCACTGCALIIPSSQHAAYRRVPERFERVEVEVAPWLARLGVPVGVAALSRRDDGTAIAAYPGAIGLVESELDADAWDALCAAVPAVGAMEREVCALVCASGGAWIAGIDVVFRLVSELRARRGVESGMFGDPEAPAAVSRFLGELARGSHP